MHLLNLDVSTCLPKVPSLKKKKSFSSCKIDLYLNFLDKRYWVSLDYSLCRSTLRPRTERQARIGSERRPAPDGLDGFIAHRELDATSCALEWFYRSFHGGVTLFNTRAARIQSAASRQMFVGIQISRQVLAGIGCQVLVIIKFSHARLVYFDLLGGCHCLCSSGYWLGALVWGRGKKQFIACLKKSYELLVWDNYNMRKIR